MKRWHIGLAVLGPSLAGLLWYTLMASQSRPYSGDPGSTSIDDAARAAPSTIPTSQSAAVGPSDLRSEDVPHRASPEWNDASVHRFVHDAVEADLPRVQQLIRDRGLDDGVRNEMMNLVRRLDEGGTKAGDILLEIASDARETDRMRDFAIQHLGMLFEDDRQQVVVAKFLAELIQDQTASMRLREEALWALAQDRHGPYRHRIDAMLASTQASKDANGIFAQVLARIVSLYHEPIPAGSQSL